MVDAPPTEWDLPRRIQALLSDRLPPGWKVSSRDETLDASVLSDSGVDGVLTVTAPDASRLRVVMECKRNLVTRDLPGVVDQLARDSGALQGSTTALVASPYLSSSVRSWLEAAGTSYADATGNIRLVSSKPALYVRDRGADRDPWRGPGRPRGTLKGIPAARVVRALVDFYPPMPMRVLAAVSGASTGAAYRVVDFLDREALIARGPRGEVTQAEWTRLIQRWSEDYSFSTDNAVSSYLQPRGLPALVKELPRLEESMSYAVTGSLAAQMWAPYAPPRLAMVYVEDVAEAAQLLGLRAVDRGANVLLAVPASPVAFDRTRMIGGVRYAAPSQAVVDLLTGPGRNPAEGQELLTWMERNEPEWRIQPADRSA